MTTSKCQDGFLRHNDSAETLDQYYRDGRWSYLGSPQYAAAYLQPLAAMCVGDAVLDVGCGEGWLAGHIGGRQYVGFDASRVAIERARRVFRNCARDRFFVGRLEDPPFLINGPDTIVFGNILEVLVKPECRLPLIDLYVTKYRPQRVIVYDMEKLDTRPIEDKYRLVAEHHGYCEVPPEGPAAKWSRKLIAFEES